MHRVLFVCMGNICRSPSAEGVFRDMAERRGIAGRFHIDSAGTGNWHVGNPPDQRASQAARERGIDISNLRARQVDAGDFELFDLVIAMDRANQLALLELAGLNHSSKVRLMLEYSEQWTGEDVPDPYYGGDHGFDLVLDLIEEACNNLLDELAGVSE